VEKRINCLPSPTKNTHESYFFSFSSKDTSPPASSSLLQTFKRRSFFRQFFNLILRKLKIEYVEIFFQMFPLSVFKNGTWTLPRSHFITIWTYFFRIFQPFKVCLYLPEGWGLFKVTVATDEIDVNTLG